MSAAMRMTDDEPADAVPTDFRVVLPPGWVRIPVTDRSTEAVVALATARARVAPPEQRESVRSGLVTLLGRAVTAARDAGGVDVLLSVDAVEGMPVPASCLVSYVEPQGDDDLPRIAEQLGGPGSDVSVVDLDSGRAVRRQSTRWAEDRGVSVVVTELSFWTPVPGRGGLLVLTFSTPSPELAPALLPLFDAIAATLRWVTR
jgi:hypothetical protein